MANSKTLARRRTATGPVPLSREAQDKRNKERKRHTTGYVGHPYADLVPKETRAAQHQLYGVPFL